MKDQKNNQNRFKPTRSLGQNFLVNTEIAEKICAAANLEQKDIVLEVGPGYGVLTEIIVGKVHCLFAIEKDRRLYSWLIKRFKGYDNLKIINGDILKVNPAELAKNHKIKFISNLPYNITSPVLELLLDNRNLYSTIVIMVQKEVGDRIASKPGTKVFGSLSVISQTYFDIKKVCAVPSGSFKPRPKVDSVVLKMVPTDKFCKMIRDPVLFNSIVRSSFSSRRKMISNSLRSSFDRESIEQCLTESGIDGKRRAETVGIDEFIKLANTFYQLQQSIS